MFHPLGSYPRMASAHSSTDALRRLNKRRSAPVGSSVNPRSAVSDTRMSAFSYAPVDTLREYDTVICLTFTARPPSWCTSYVPSDLAWGWGTSRRKGRTWPTPFRSWGLRSRSPHRLLGKEGEGLHGLRLEDSVPPGAGPAGRPPSPPPALPRPPAAPHGGAGGG